MDLWLVELVDVGLFDIVVPEHVSHSMEEIQKLVVPHLRRFLPVKHHVVVMPEAKNFRIVEEHHVNEVKGGDCLGTWTTCDSTWIERSPAELKPLPPPSPSRELKISQLPTVQ